MRNAFQVAALATMTASFGCTWLLGIDKEYGLESNMSNDAGGCGGMNSEGADGDVSNSGKECTLDTCVRGMPIYTPKSPGTPCGKDGRMVCNDTGDCVECLTTQDCTASEICENHQCTLCANGMTDGAETGIDCGGPTCAKCTKGNKCLVDSDCLSGNCKGSKCH